MPCLTNSKSLWSLKDIFCNKVASGVLSECYFWIDLSGLLFFRDSVEIFDNLCETFPDENCVLSNREISVEVWIKYIKENDLTSFFFTCISAKMYAFFLQP